MFKLFHLDGSRHARWCARSTRVTACGTCRGFIKWLLAWVPGHVLILLNIAADSLGSFMEVSCLWLYSSIDAKSCRLLWVSIYIYIYISAWLISLHLLGPIWGWMLALWISSVWRVVFTLGAWFTMGGPSTPCWPCMGGAFVIVFLSENETALALSTH